MAYLVKFNQPYDSSSIIGKKNSYTDKMRERYVAIKIKLRDSMKMCH